MWIAHALTKHSERTQWHRREAVSIAEMGCMMSTEGSVTRG